MGRFRQGKGRNKEFHFHLLTSDRISNPAVHMRQPAYRRSEHRGKRYTAARHGFCAVAGVFCVEMACFCGCRGLAGKGVEKCTESDYIRDYEQYLSEASLYFGEK